MRKTPLILIISIFIMGVLEGRALASDPERLEEKDSLKKELRKASKDSVRLRILDRLLRYTLVHPDSLEKYVDKGLELARTKGDSSLIRFFKARAANVELKRSNYSAALDSFLDVARKAEKAGDSSLMARCYNGVGSIFNETGKTKKARHYHEKALAINKALRDSPSIASSYNNLGISLMMMQKFDTGMTMWRRAVDMKLAMGDSLGATGTMTNMAKHYRHLERYDKAEEVLKRAIRIHQKYEDPIGHAIAHLTLSRVHWEQKQNKKALRHAEKGLSIAKSTDSKGLIANAYRKLFRVCARMDRYKKAYHYHREFKKVQDSIRAEQEKKRLAEIEAKYQNEKKKLRIEKQQARLKAQRREKLALWGGVGVLFLLALLILWNYFQKQKDNRIIAEEKERVEEQKELVQEKNAEIMDSIDYSQRLQEAILPGIDSFRRAFPYSFVLYLPKEAVAGDFYWLVTFEDRVLFAAADCTGHGVPGAMVSVVCFNALNRSVKEFGIVEPARILEKADELVMETFEASEEEVKDGMDITLCSLKPATGELSVAAANNPLYHIRPAREGDEDKRRCLVKEGRTLEEFRADKQGIGGRTEKDPFHQHELQLEKEDAVYLFSDGYADQFGGPKGKKFKYRPFKELLLDTYPLSPQEQERALLDRFREWKGELEQVDDVCVIGVKYERESA